MQISLIGWQSNWWRHLLSLAEDVQLEICLCQIGCVSLNSLKLILLFIFDWNRPINMPLVDFAHLQGLRFMLELQLDKDTHLCGECGPAMQHSGRCHNYTCSNSGAIASLNTKLHNDILHIQFILWWLLTFSEPIQNKLSQHNYPHDHTSLKIVQTIQRKDFSALIMYNCI